MCNRYASSVREGWIRAACVESASQPNYNVRTTIRQLTLVQSGRMLNMRRVSCSLESLQRYSKPWSATLTGAFCSGSSLGKITRATVGPGGLASDPAFGRRRIRSKIVAFRPLT